jgi:hypothetical protein
METLQIEKANAVKAYHAADSKGKQLLQDLFGKDKVPGNVTDRIKTFEDACKELGIQRDNVYCNYDAIDESAYKKLKIIVAALNEGWIPDWTNSKQYKYYPYFDLSSGSGLVYDDCGYGYAGSSVGSRLCLRSEDLAKYAGTQFKDIYTDFFILK